MKLQHLSHPGRMLHFRACHTNLFQAALNHVLISPPDCQNVASQHFLKNQTPRSTLKLSKVRVWLFRRFWKPDPGPVSAFFWKHYHVSITKVCLYLYRPYTAENYLSSHLQLLGKQGTDSRGALPKTRVKARQGKGWVPTHTPTPFKLH